MSQEEKNSIMDSMTQLKNVNQGQELKDVPDVSHSSGDGYSEVGKIYQDPRTGKMIMIEQ